MSSYNVVDSQRNSASASKAKRMTPKAKKTWQRIAKERRRDACEREAGLARIAALTQRAD